ncbi:uncharacterized protein VTP21DRAFT_3586 [Calcarisporiella thermophila]|uniref:uncharacterized protein n=1 Tax=Calcarisporiella thermophila TaxID=911321 RepID=UPI003743E795
MDSMLEDIPEADFTESSQRAWEQQQEIEDEFERRRRARTIAVPTDDKKVRLKLRELGEPQCLFGEGPGDRRDRLRYLLSKLEGVEVEDEEEESEESEEEEEFYTEGSMQLLAARREIARYSLPRARARLARQREEQEFTLPQLKSARRDLNEKLKTFANFSSQIEGERPVSASVFAPNSKIVATGSWTGLCKLWSVPQSECILTLRGHTERVGGIAFHPEAFHTLDQSSANLVSGAADGSVYLWSLDRDTPLASLKGHQLRVARVAFHPSGRYVGTASHDTTWRLWDVEKRHELLCQEGHAKEVHAIAFQDDGALVGSGGFDAIGRVWDLRTGRSAMVLQGHVNDIYAIDFSPNGYQVATGSADNSVRIWDLRSLKQLHVIPAHNSLVSDVKFFHHHAPHTEKPETTGLFLVSGGFDGSVRIWSADDWRMVRSLEGHDGKVASVDVSGDRQWIVSGGFDRTFKLWSQEGNVY